MADHLGVLGPGDVASDLEVAAWAEKRIAAIFAGAPLEVRSRTLHSAEGLRGLRSVPAQAGSLLMAACGEQTRRRYQTLLYFEEKVSAEDDHGFLIAAACSVLEAALDRVLTLPARGIADALVAALHAEEGPARILEDWIAGKPAPIGTQTIILLALRRGCEQGSEPVCSFLADHFQPRYQSLLLSKKLGRCLDRIRQQFRNPACHGTTAFDAPAYEQFARLAVVRRRFTEWDVAGAGPAEPEADCGVLHHHLRLSRLRERPGIATGPPAEGVPAGEPLRRLLALQTPAESPLRVDLRPHHAEEAADLRDIRVTSGEQERLFRLGDRIRFAFQSNCEAHVVLIDVGTGGQVAVVWPNLWHKDTRVEGGRPHFVPALDSPEFEFTLLGRTGTEKIKALVTLRPLAAALLPEAATPFRVLTPRDLQALVDEVRQLDPATWAATRCEFVIEPRQG
jgi:hypothetical protein